MPDANAIADGAGLPIAADNAPVRSIVFNNAFDATFWDATTINLAIIIALLAVYVVVIVELYKSVWDPEGGLVPASDSAGVRHMLLNFRR
jgi:hypothetical protein